MTNKLMPKAKKAILITTLWLSALAGLAQVVVYNGDVNLTDPSQTYRVFLDYGSTATRVLLATDQVGSGTGNFPAMLRIGTKNGPSYTEQAINFPYHTAIEQDYSSAWNQPFQYSSLQPGVITYSGGSYYQFALDANEPGSAKASLISLNSFRVFASSTLYTSDDQLSAAFLLNPDISVPNSDRGDRLIYSLDSVIPKKDFTVLLNAKTQSGAGSGHMDLSMYVPTSLFGTAKKDDYLYVYASMGQEGAYSADAGFEEWRYNSTAGALVPEPYEYGFVGVILLAGLAGHHVVRQRKPAVAFR